LSIIQTIAGTLSSDERDSKFMHESAFDKFIVFTRTYLAPYAGSSLDVLDVGSRAIGAGSASHRPTIIANGWNYLGIDLEPGENVDLVVADGNDWTEILDNSYDVVLCSQVLEHTRYPWRLAQEIARVLRPRGVALLIAPSSGHVHRYPEDCFRYFPDGFPALASTAGLLVIESHVQQRLVYRSNIWLDAVAVLQKPMRSPLDEARERARLELGRLMLKPDLNSGHLAMVEFAPKASKASPLADLAASSPGHVFADHDAALARKFDPLRRFAEGRRHLSRAIKALTRPI
jgi:SAM-dependent methyltransferase